MNITLTFDNGPSDTTGQVLRALRSAGVTATFFVVGQKLDAPEGPNLLREVLAAGHGVGNHTYTHSTPLGLCSPNEGVSEIERTASAMEALGVPRGLFRPFGRGGHLDSKLLSTACVDYLVRERMSCVTWNCVPRDWEQPDRWVETAIQQVCLVDWAVVVLHDVPNCGSTHVPEFIDRAKSMGAVFTTDFPESCVAIRHGAVTPHAAALVTACDAGRSDEH